jgi:hypothetical protein
MGGTPLLPMRDNRDAPPCSSLPYKYCAQQPVGGGFFGRKREKKGGNGRKKKEVLKERRIEFERERGLF